MRGIVPKDIMRIDRISEARDGETVVFEGSIKSFAIQLSPPLDVVMKFPDDFGEELEVRDGKFHTSMLDYDVQIGDGQLVIEPKEGKGKGPVVECFNRIIAVMNILGIPQDFVSPYDIILMVEDADGQVVPTFFSEKAKRRARGLASVEVSDIDIAYVALFMWAVWEGIKKSQMLNVGHVYKFLGYARYSHFHGDYLSSFINGWIFIEAMIQLLWEEEIKVKYPSKASSPLKRERDWTAQIMIEELYMLDVFDFKTKKRLQRLRKKRNSVFHPEEKMEKRVIEKKDSQDCVLAGVHLFYKVLGLWEEGKFIDAPGIRNRIFQAIHREVRGEEKDS